MTAEKRPICQVCGEPIEGTPSHWDNTKGGVREGGDPRLPVHDRLRCPNYDPQMLLDFANVNAPYFAGRGEPVLFDGTPEGRRRVAKAVKATNRRIERYMARIRAQHQANLKALGFDKTPADRKRQAARTT